MGFSRQEYWSGLSFPSPANHILSEPATMTHLSWMALHGMARSCIELDKAVVHVIRLFSFLWLWFSVCPLMEKDKRVMKASWWERLTEGTRSCSDGRAILSSVQFSHTVLSDSLWPHESQHTRPPCPSSTHVHRVSDAIQPSHPLSSPSPPAPKPSRHQSLF